MAILERILTRVGQTLEGELSSTSDSAPQATAGLESSGTEKATAPIYQLSPLPLSLKLADYKDAWSNSNPEGDPLAVALLLASF